MGATLRILTVDDEPSITHSMRFIFAGPRYEVTGAENGDDALAKLDANSDAYDVIIIDLNKTVFIKRATRRLVNHMEPTATPPTPPASPPPPPPLPSRPNWWYRNWK